MAEHLFEKYYRRVAKEGILKAMLFALLIAFSVLAVTVTVSWFFGFKAGLWIGLALFAVTLGAMWPLFYYLKYRPTTKEIAKRVDALGLEERVLTMTELENDSSYIAMKQREDTIKALGTVNHMLVKIVVSTGLCVAVAVCAVLGLSATTTQSLYVAGVIPSGKSLLEKTLPVETYRLSYAVQSGTTGHIVYWDEEWDEEVAFEEDYVTVKEGESGPGLYALCEEGWRFTGWSDGVKTPYRQDVDVHKDVVAIALFEQVKEDEIPDDDGVRNDSGDPSDNDGDQPGAPGSDSQMNQTEPGGDDEGGIGSGEGAGGNSAPNNQIKDGETYYGDEYDSEYGDAMGRLESDNELPGDLKGGVSDYYDSIQKGSSGESNP